MKKTLIAALLCACACAANATVLTFDDVPAATQDGYGALGSYAGYTFGATGEADRMDWIDTVTANEFFNRGAVSGDFTMLNNYGGAAVIRKDGGGEFAFGGLWAANGLAWDSSRGSIQGYRNGSLVWETGVSFAGDFVHVAGVAGTIDTLRIDSGGFFLVDDLELNAPSSSVPVPPTAALMGIGMAGLVLLRRKKRA